MKIVHICQYFCEKLGYQEFNLVKAQANLGHNIIVITSNRYFPFPDYKTTYEKIIGNRIIKKKDQLKNQKNNFELIRKKPIFEIPSSSTLLLPKYYNILKKNKPDIIICHGLLNPNSVWACIYKKNNPKTKLIFDTHAATYNSNFNTLVKKLYLILWKIFIKNIILKNSNKIVATGENEKIFIQKYLFNKEKNKIDIIPLGADTTIFFPNPKIKEKIRNKLGFTNDDFVIINAGKINESKKIFELVKIFYQIQKICPITKLLLVGGGNKKYINTIKIYIKNKKISNKIKFINTMPNKKLPQFLNAADLGVWPGSKSNVFVEAIACGLPIIIENKKYAHIYTSNKNGYNISISNRLKLKKTIIDLIQNPAKIKIMSKNSYSLCQQKFDWNILAQHFISF